MKKSSYTDENKDPQNTQQFQNISRNFMSISHSVAQRLQTGLVEEERLRNYDQNWIDKLSEMDQNHTIEQNIDIVVANQILNSLSTYTSKPLITTCPVDKKKIIECYTLMKGDTLKCEPEVKEFINCIDNLLYKATHIDERKAISFACPKKMTYRERFEQTCLNK